MCKKLIGGATDDLPSDSTNLLINPPVFVPRDDSSAPGSSPLVQTPLQTPKAGTSGGRSVSFSPDYPDYFTSPDSGGASGDASGGGRITLNIQPQEPQSITSQILKELDFVYVRFFTNLKKDPNLTNILTKHKQIFENLKKNLKIHSLETPEDQVNQVIGVIIAKVKYIAIESRSFLNETLTLSNPSLNKEGISFYSSLLSLRILINLLLMYDNLCDSEYDPFDLYSYLETLLNISITRDRNAIQILALPTYNRFVMYKKSDNTYDFYKTNNPYGQIRTTSEYKDEDLLHDFEIIHADFLHVFNDSQKYHWAAFFAYIYAIQKYKHATIIAILGKARTRNGEIPLIALSTQRILSYINFLKCNIAILTGAYYSNFYNDHGITRSAYEIAKKLEKPSLGVICKVGLNTTNSNLDVLCGYGIHWGDDTPLLTMICDCAIVNAPFGPWTEIELINLLYRRKITAIYLSPLILALFYFNSKLSSFILPDQIIDLVVEVRKTEDAKPEAFMSDDKSTLSSPRLQETQQKLLSFDNSIKTLYAELCEKLVIDSIITADFFFVCIKHIIKYLSRKREYFQAYVSNKFLFSPNLDSFLINGKNLQDIPINNTDDREYDLLYRQLLIGLDFNDETELEDTFDDFESKKQTHSSAEESSAEASSAEAEGGGAADSRVDIDTKSSNMIRWYPKNQSVTSDHDLSRDSIPVFIDHVQLSKYIVSKVQDIQLQQKIDNIYNAITTFFSEKSSNPSIDQLRMIFDKNHKKISLNRNYVNKMAKYQGPFSAMNISMSPSYSQLGSPIDVWVHR